MTVSHDDTRPLRILLLAGSTADPSAIIRSAIGNQSVEKALADACGGIVEVTAVTWADSATAIDGVRSASSVGGLPARGLEAALLRAGARHLVIRLQSFPAGRLLNSIGPLDPSRLFWRRVRTGLTALGSPVDVAIALDLPAARTGWFLQRSGRAGHAYFGLQSTLKILSVQRDATRQRT